MSDRQNALVLALPLWRVLELDAGYLRHEIEKAAQKFGIESMRTPAAQYGQVDVRIEITQGWTWSS